jgi:putative transposase
LARTCNFNEAPRWPHHLGRFTPLQGTLPAERPQGQRNQRNGTSPKTIQTNEGALTLEIPRDRQGSFEPQLIPKHQRRFAGFDEKIIALYARGMTVREIQAHLEELYAVEVSPQLISEVTDAVLAEVSDGKTGQIYFLSRGR